MLPDIAVVVPTYWTRAGGRAAPGDAVYDHPTPLDEDGTVERLLRSLTILDTSRFWLLIVVAVTAPDIEADARSKAAELAGRVPQLSSLVFSSSDLDALLASADLDSPPVRALLGLRGYPSVRNLHLAVPIALGAEAIVALDDDEVVTDPDFLDKAVKYLGEVEDGHSIDGISGYYEQSENGSILLAVDPKARNASNMFDRKSLIMNEATQKLEADPRNPIPTPFCFGGNMIFNKELASSVFFDPAITRGEDIDYLINARLEGKWFFMNKALRILHLPPHGGSYKDVAYHKVVQDVTRFVYEREKVRHSSAIGSNGALDVEDLMPYPGKFLTPSLDSDAEQVISRIFSNVPAAEWENLQLGGSPTEFMERARTLASRALNEFQGHRTTWRAIMSRLSSHSRAAKLLLDRVSISVPDSGE